MPLQFMSLLSEDRWGTWHTFSFKAFRKSKCFGTKQCYDDFVLDSLIYVSLLVDVNKLSEMHLVHAKYKITIIINLVFVTSVITWVRVNTCYRNELLPYCKYVFYLTFYYKSKFVCQKICDCSFWFLTKWTVSLSIFDDFITLVTFIFIV